MKNIVDLVIETINEVGPITTKQICGRIESDVLKNKEQKELEAIIYTDLLMDGRFLKVCREWDLKDKYTMREVMREQYRSLGEIDDEFKLDESEVVIEEEIELKTIIEDNDDEVVISVNDLEV